MIEEHPLVDATPFKCKCQRCAHEWWTRTPNKPKRCAFCKALYWDRPARVPAPKIQRGPRGGPRKYPFHDIEIGDSVLMPFYRLENGQADTRKNSSMQCAVLNYSRRSGKKFRRVVEGTTGIRVTRTA